MRFKRPSVTDRPSFRVWFLFAFFFGASSALFLPKLISFLRFHPPILFRSENCLSPISDLWPCDLPRQVAAEPMDFIGAGMMLLLLVLPWEIARRFAIARKRNRLFWFLTTVVNVFVLLLCASWYDRFWEDRRMLLFGVLGETALEPAVIDFLRLWYLESRIAWAQLIPAAFVAAIGYSDAKAPVRQEGPFSPKFLNSLLWIGIAAGVTYELVSEIVPSLMGLSRKHILFHVAKPLGGLIALVVVAKHAWFLQAAPALGVGATRFGGESNLVLLLRIYQVLLWLFVFLSLSLLALQASFPPGLDVVPSPSGRSHAVCPFLSTAELNTAVCALLTGIVFGELIKIAAPALPERSRLWRVGVHWQIWVAVPAASALSWNWLQAAVAFIISGATLGDSIPALAEELRTLRGGPAPWLLIACAVFGARSASSELVRCLRELARPANDRFPSNR